MGALLAASGVGASGRVGLIRNAGATLLVSSETAVLGPPTQPQANGIMFLFHNVIMLRYIELPSQTGRTLSVVKMRNSDHSKQLHQLEVGTDGLRGTGTLERPTGVLGWTALRAPDPTR